MSLTVWHVLLVVVGTIVGAGLGRYIKQRSPRLRFLNEVARAVLFVLGIIVAVALVAYARASGLEKSVLVGFYIGAVYGLIASDPPRRQPAPVPPETETAPPDASETSDSG